MRAVASLASLAGAIAITVGPASAGALASALPDGRAYELVSEAQKNANQAGVETAENETSNGSHEVAITVVPGEAWEAPEGDRILYFQSGPAGQTKSGADFYSVATRGASGWSSVAALPPGYGSNASEIVGEQPKQILPSEELDSLIFEAGGPFGAGNTTISNAGVYRTIPGAGEAEEWLSRPLVTDPQPSLVPLESIKVAGGSPSLDTVYFAYAGSLVPEDSERAVVGAEHAHADWGFYEWTQEGGTASLHAAGELPSGHVSPYGALPAATLEETPGASGLGGFQQDNEVSSSGEAAFFVSPQPRNVVASSPETGQTREPTELYEREQGPSGPRTVLVSRDELNGGSPAQGMGSSEVAVTPVSGSYVYASPDGSHAFFESMDKLAKDRTGTAEPTGTGPWMYEFDADAEGGRGEVAWLPEAEGQILTASQDGSRFLFLQQEEVNIVIEEYEERSEEYESREEARVLPTSLDIWEEGAVRTVASWPPPGPIRVPPEGSPTEDIEKQIYGPEFAYAARDGDAFVFETAAPLSGEAQPFNNVSGTPQIYRYEPAGANLACLSCAPAGSESTAASSGTEASPVADEGRRVFFTSASRLATGDVNAVGDVYEWEQSGTGSCALEEVGDGCLYMVSSGTSPDASLYLGSDAAGENVFFATDQALDPEDSDGAYDVYDARVGGGFPPAGTPTPCAEDCQGPGASFSPPTPLSSSGPSGNLAPPRKEASKAKGKTRAEKLAAALRKCRHKPKRHRARCKARARHRYGAKRSKTGKAKRSKRSAGKRRSA